MPREPPSRGNGFCLKCRCSMAMEQSKKQRKPRVSFKIIERFGLDSLVFLKRPSWITEIFRDLKAKCTMKMEISVPKNRLQFRRIFFRYQGVHLNDLKVLINPVVLASTCLQHRV